jgi:hypothetical protein
MSKTPITDEAWKKYATDNATGFNIALDMRRTCIEIETQLNQLKAQFAEYVKSEDDWRDEFDREKSDDLRIVASKLRKQAKEALEL